MNIPTYDGWPDVTAKRLRKVAKDSSLAPYERIAAAHSAITLERPVLTSRVMAMTGLSPEEYAAGVDDLQRTGLVAPGSGASYVFGPGKVTLAALVPSFDPPEWQENLPSPGFEISTEEMKQAFRDHADDRPGFTFDDEAEVAA